MNRILQLEATVGEIKALLENGVHQAPGQAPTQTLTYNNIVTKTEVLENAEQVTRNAVSEAVNKIETALASQSAAITQGKTDMQAIQDKAQVEFKNIKDSVDADSIKIKSVIQEADSKQQDIAKTQQEVIESAKVKFAQMETDTQNKLQELSSVVQAVQVRISQAEGWMHTLNEAATLDAEELRKEMIKKMDGGRSGRQVKDISDYKVISNLQTIPDGKADFVVWLEEFKSALVQARGKAWKNMLEEIDRANVKEDSENP